MKKSKRLIFLLNYLIRNGSFQLTKIAGHCQISERTVYRDIKELKDLGYPMVFSDGYSLKIKAPHGELTKLNAAELRMVKFALETHPLGNLFPFSELAEKINCTKITIKKLTGKLSAETFTAEKTLPLHRVSLSSSDQNPDSIHTKIEKGEDPTTCEK